MIPDLASVSLSAPALLLCLGGIAGLAILCLRQRNWLAEQESAITQRQREFDARLEAAAENARRCCQTATGSLRRAIDTPANGIFALARMLGQGERDPQRRAQLQRIADSSRAILRLADLLLNESSSDEVPLDIRQQLEELVTIYEPMVQSRQLAIGMWVETTVPERLALDALLVREILTNLVENAIRFTRRGGIDIEARLENSTVGQSLLLSVIDTGIGIEDVRLPTIFSGGRDPEAAREHPAIIPGLVTSSRLARSMGGTISVQSLRDVGSQFTVRLPLTGTRTAPRSETGSETAPAPPAPLASLDGAHVLIAVNDQASRCQISAIAKELNCNARSVIGGAAAVKAVTECDRAGMPFAVVLMDVAMTDLDGLEATRRLRSLGFSADILPVVALSASCLPQDIAACAAAGMQSHLAKPVDRIAMARELSRWLVAGHVPGKVSRPVAD